MKKRYVVPVFTGLMIYVAAPMPICRCAPVSCRSVPASVQEPGLLCHQDRRPVSGKHDARGDCCTQCRIEKAAIQQKCGELSSALRGCDFRAGLSDAAGSMRLPEFLPPGAFPDDERSRSFYVLNELTATVSLRGPPRPRISFGY